MSLKLDSTINLQHLIGSLISVFIAVIMVYFSMTLKVNALTKDVEISTKERLEIKEVANEKIKELTQKIDAQTELLIAIRLELVNKANREGK